MQTLPFIVSRHYIVQSHGHIRAAMLSLGKIKHDQTSCLVPTHYCRQILDTQTCKRDCITHQYLSLIYAYGVLIPLI